MSIIYNRVFVEPSGYCWRSAIVARLEFVLQPLLNALSSFCTPGSVADDEVGRS